MRRLFIRYGPRREKICGRGLRQSETQASLYSYRDKLENRNFACSKLRYGAFPKTNKKGADQTARMRRLVCIFFFAALRRQVFSRRGSYVNGDHIIWVCSTSSNTQMGAQWLGGRVLDSRPNGRRFEPHRRHCVVIL